MTTITPFQLTFAGFFHTLVSLVALGAAAIALLKDGRIVPGNRVGLVYRITLLVTSLTAFLIFRHGTFGPPHALAVISLLVLALATAAGKPGRFGRGTPYVELVSYTTTIFLLMIPGFTETLTRVPISKPVAASPDDPVLKIVNISLLLVFLVGVALQVRAERLRRHP